MLMLLGTQTVEIDLMDVFSVFLFFVTKIFSCFKLHSIFWPVGGSKTHWDLNSAMSILQSIFGNALAKKKKNRDSRSCCEISQTDLRTDSAGYVSSSQFFFLLGLYKLLTYTDS